MKTGVISISLLLFLMLNPGASAAGQKTQAGTIIVGEFNPGKGLAVIKGKYDPKKSYSEWKPKKQDPMAPPPEDDWPLKTIPFKQGTVERLYFFTQRADHGECQTCGATISAAAMTKVANGWRVDAVARNVLVQGAHGYGHGGELVKIGAERFGVLFETGGGNRGYYAGSKAFVYEHRGKLKDLSIYDTSGDNTGACTEKEKCYSFDSTISFLPALPREFFDILVVTRGTDSERLGDGIIKINRTRRYTFNRGVYTLAQMTGEPATDKEAMQFIEVWLRLSEKNENFGAIMALYAEEVEFYKQGKVKKAAIEEDKNKYFDKWPKREHALQSIDISDNNEIGDKMVSLEFHYTLSDGRKSIEGRAGAVLVLHKMERGFVIVSERER
ncbi:MAG TPA: hypothetical protein DCS42_00785 [Nitrospiraceae bacterium]|nr:hypothetical protein [Nitrospiraceae bacterium]